MADDGKRASAVALAEMGIRVFKLPAGQKEPPPYRFYDVASSDVPTVRGWWTDEDGWAEAFNIGVLTGEKLPDGRQLHVIDVDNKPGKTGWDALEELQLMGLDIDTMRVTTPSGGIHLYYGCPPDWPQLSSGPDRLGRGVDTRGFHGYAVGPGSSTPAGTYEWTFNKAIATLPDWMLEHLQPRRALGSGAGQWLVEPDQPGDIARAISHVKAYPVPPEGQRNPQTYMLAVDLRDMGISQESAQEIMTEHWGLIAATPDPEEFQFSRTIASVYGGSAQRPAGTRSIAYAFDDVAAELPASATVPTAVIDKAIVDKRKKRFKIETIQQLRDLPALKWLVGGWFPEGGSGILYGRWGSGKSFIVFDLAMHLALGKQEWHGASLPGVECPVLIIASEGKDGFMQRIDAYKTAYGLKDDPANLHFMRESVNFMDEKDFRALCEVIAEAGVKYRMIMIDTVGRTLPGTDSNTQEAISMFMQRCRDLGAVTGATTIGVHHENKSGGMLGSIVFENDSDFIYHVSKLNPDAPLSEVELHCVKLKDGKDGWSRNATFLEVITANAETSSLVIDNMGTVNVKPTGAPAAAARPKSAGPYTPSLADCQAFLDALQAAWDAGTPWNESNRAVALGLNIYVHADRMLTPKARWLVKTWMGSVIRKERVRVDGVKKEGFKVVGSLDPDIEMDEAAE